MSGVKALVYLLVNNAAIDAVMDTGAIMGGDIPEDLDLPVMITVKTISGNPHNNLSLRATGVLHRERVQVTVMAHGREGQPAGDGYLFLKNLMALLIPACCTNPPQRGMINGVWVEAIIPDAEGPDTSNLEASIYGSSRDFFVVWKS